MSLMVAARIAEGGDLPEPDTHSKIRQPTEDRNSVQSHPIGDAKVPEEKKKWVSVDPSSVGFISHVTLCPPHTEPEVTPLLSCLRRMVAYIHSQLYQVQIPAPSQTSCEPEQAAHSASASPSAKQPSTDSPILGGAGSLNEQRHLGPHCGWNSLEVLQLAW